MKHAIVPVIILLFTPVGSGQTTKEEQSAFTPDKVLADLMAGNARFVSGKPRAHDIKANLTQTAAGQYP